MGAARLTARRASAVILLNLLIVVESQEPPKQCTTSSGSYGACVFLTSCPSLLNLLRTGDKKFQDLVKLNHCGFDGVMPKVCCNNEVQKPSFNFPKDVESATASSKHTSTQVVATETPAHYSPLVTHDPPPESTAPHSSPPPISPPVFRPSVTSSSEQNIVENLNSAVEEVFLTTSRPVPTWNPPKTTRRHLNTQPVSPSSTESSSDVREQLLPNRTVCGNIGTKDKIYGGVNSTIDDFPWMALLQYRVGALGHFGCGGVLISDRYVLTAAHCVRTTNAYKLSQVRLGEWDLDAEVDCEDEQCNAPPQDVDVEEALVHPEFEPRNLTNDIALLRLAVSVNFTDWIQPICLPSSEEQDFTEQTFWVAGWGQTEDGSSSPRKRKIEVGHVELEVCSAAYRRLQIDVGAGNLCAGGRRGQDTCSGDSGGALMKQIQRGHHNNYYAVGIVSLGPQRCGLEGWPGVYTKLSYYADWIRENLRS